MFICNKGYQVRNATSDDCCNPELYCVVNGTFNEPLSDLDFKIASGEINRVTVKGGAGMPTSEYAQLVYKGEEIGFISEQGIFLKMWHPELKAGVFQNINTFNDKSFAQKCKLVEKNWGAIYDRYTTIIRGK